MKSLESIYLSTLFSVKPSQVCQHQYKYNCVLLFHTYPTEVLVSLEVLFLLGDWAGNGLGCCLLHRHQRSTELSSHLALFLISFTLQNLRIKKTIFSKVYFLVCYFELDMLLSFKYHPKIEIKKIIKKFILVKSILF